MGLQQENAAGFFSGFFRSVCLIKYNVKIDKCAKGKIAETIVFKNTMHDTIDIKYAKTVHKKYTDKTCILHSYNRVFI